MADWNMLKHYLDWAGRLFRKIHDEFYVGIVRAWHKDALTKLGINEQQEWYYAPSR